MRRSGLSVFRKVNRTFFSTHAAKATLGGSVENHMKGSVGVRTAGSFERRTSITVSEKTKDLLDLEENTLAKVSYGINGMLNIKQQTNLSTVI